MKPILRFLFTMSLVAFLCFDPPSISFAEYEETVAGAVGGPISDALKMGGVAGFVAGRARGLFREALSGKGAEWMSEAFAKAIKDHPGREGTKANLNCLFRQDPELKAAVQAELKKRLKEWMPGAMKKLIVEGLFGNALSGDQVKEAYALADRVMKELDTSMNAQVDALVGGSYDTAVRKLRELMAQRQNYPGLRDLDPMDVKGSLDRIFSLEHMGDVVAQQLGGIVGEATVTGMRGRITDALDGKLPPEVVAALKKGPEEFDKYVKEAQKYFPGNALSNLKDSLLNRPLIKLPTQAYAAILAASAAGHFSKAFSGAIVNVHELRRGAEVVRVMVWQVNNKDHITLSIMQLADLGRALAGHLGAGDMFDRAMSKVREPFDRIQKLADGIDKTIMKPIKEVQGELKKMTDEMQKQLLDIQEKIVSPIRDGFDSAQDELDKAKDAIEEALPDGFNGIPPDWEALKKQAGLGNGVLGKWGDKTPNDILSEAGLDLNKLNDDAADKLSKAGADALEAAGLLGPVAEILGLERIPALNVSYSGELDPVLLHNGEFVQGVTDVVIPGRGIDFRFTRTYRGRSDFPGELGWRWTHSYAERLRPWNDGAGDGLIHINEEGRKFFFRAESEGFVSPPGIYANLSRKDDGYEIACPDGLVTIFDLAGRPVAKHDGNGNRVKLLYGGDGLLSTVVDVFGRKVEFERRRDGLITKMKDFSGRAFIYEYNEEKELIGVTTPATPDFPKGKTTAYRYEEAQGDGASRHLISMIMDPAGRVYLKNRYDEGGRVVSQSYGDSPWMTVVYEARTTNDERPFDFAQGRRTTEVASRAWITDANGVLRLYEHDKEGHLLRLWRYDGVKYLLLASYGYDSDGEMTAECKSSGLCRLFTYGDGDMRGKAQRFEDRPAGGGAPRVTVVEREPAGEFEYNRFGQIIREVDDRGVVTRYEYNPSRDPDGDGVVIAGAPVDADGGYLKSIVRDAEALLFEYDPLGNVVVVTYPDKSTSRYVVNALNQITREEAPGLPPRVYRYDANDNVVSLGYARSDGSSILEYEHGVLDRVTLKREFPSANTPIETRYSYDPAGRLTGVVHPEGNVDAFEYDKDGWPLCVVRGANSIERSRLCVERDRDGNVTALIDGEGARTKFDLNGFGEVIAEVDPLGNRTEYDRDAAGRVIAERVTDASRKALAETRFEYDKDGRLLKLGKRLWREDPKSSVWVEEKPLLTVNAVSMAAPSGAKTGVADPGGIETAYETDGMGRVIAVTRGSGDEKSKIHYSWDGNGRLAAIEDGNGNVTRFAYDDLDRLIVERYADGTERRTAYDARDLVTASIDRNGSIILAEHDVAGRLVARSVEAASGVIGTRYQKFSYDGMGRLTEAFDGGEEDDVSDDVLSRFVYDSLSRPVAESLNGKWLSRDFDSLGNIVRLGLPSGETFFYSRDSQGRVNSIMRGAGRVAALEYGARGAIAKKLGKNIRLELKRDDQGLLYDWKYLNGGGVLLAGAEIHAEGGFVTSEVFDRGVRRIYSRDPMGRLAGVDDVRSDMGSDVPDIGVSVLERWRFSYDAAGNITSRSHNDEAQSFQVSEVGALASPPFKYDAAGNLVSDGAREFRYDVFGRLAGVWKDGRQAAGYSYDALDRLVSDGSREYLWDGYNIVEESGADGGYTDFVYDGELRPPIAMFTKDSEKYLLSDRLGSVIGAADGDGKMTSRFSFGPYGEPIEGTGVPFGFTGFPYDSATGLYYARYRFYDPALSRFISPDPLQDKASHQAMSSNRDFPSPSYHLGQGQASRATFPNRPLSVSARYDAYPFGRMYRWQDAGYRTGEPNLYVYAHDDPSMFTDSLGLASLLFDRKLGEMRVLDLNDKMIAAYPASNLTTRPKADPRRLGGRGPIPIGTFTIGPPEFYSQTYRDDVYEQFGLSGNERIEGESLVTNGATWADDRAERARHPKLYRNYNVSQGLIRLRIGAGTRGVDKIAWDRELFIHGGRKNSGYTSKTQGCIRMPDAELEDLAAQMVELNRNGDPVTSLTVEE